MDTLAWLGQNRLDIPIELVRIYYITNSVGFSNVSFSDNSISHFFINKIQNQRVEMNPPEPPLTLRCNIEGLEVKT